MKKLLVVLLSAIFVLSLAAVSMAAATVEGDWRYEWKSVENDPITDGDMVFNANDLRLNFNGKVSDTVDAYMQYTFGTEVKMKEYFVTFKQSWATIKAGQWDHKLLPDRVILKLHNINCINAANVGNKAIQTLIDVPVGDAFTVGLWMLPTLEEDKADMDVKLAYKTDSFGVEVHQSLLANSDQGSYQSFSAFYNVTDTIKVFAEGINADDDYMTVLGSSAWDDNMATAVGGVFKNIGGSNLTASIEYALANVTDTIAGDEFAPMGVQLKYGFNNKVNLEIEYYNYNKNAKQNIIVIRPRVKF